MKTFIIDELGVLLFYPEDKEENTVFYDISKRLTKNDVLIYRGEEHIPLFEFHKGREFGERIKRMKFVFEREIMTKHSSSGLVRVESLNPPFYYREEDLGLYMAVHHTCFYPRRIFFVSSFEWEQKIVLVFTREFCHKCNRCVINHRELTSISESFYSRFGFKTAPGCVFCNTKCSHPGFVEVEHYVGMFVCKECGIEKCYLRNYAPEVLTSIDRPVKNNASGLTNAQENYAKKQLKFRLKC